MRKFILSVMVILSLLLIVPTEVSMASMYGVKSPIVIYEVYGGGGEVGSIYKNEFIVLKNVSKKTEDMSKWKIGHYTTSGNSIVGLTNLYGSLEPEEYYLIKCGSGPETAKELPRTADFITSEDFRFETSSFAIELRLINNGMDLVGVKTTNKYSTQTATGADIKHSLRRISNTGNNFNDFKPVDLTEPDVLNYLIRGSDRIYNVEFKTMEGLTIEGEKIFSVKSGNTIPSIPKISEKENYEFIGWTADLDCDDIKSGETLTEEKILSAKISGNIVFTANSKYIKPIIPDRTPPKIYGVAESKDYYIGQNIDLLTGIYAVDNKDGNIIVTVSPEVIDNSKAGVYKVIYRAIDSSENVTEIESLITIIERELKNTYHKEDIPMDLSEFIFYSNVVVNEPKMLENNLWKNPFIDINSSDWHYNAIKYINERNLMNGVEINRFSPTSLINRGMIVEILYRIAGRPSVNSNNPFNDLDENDYFHSSVIWAKENGIVNGISKNEFGATNSLTREELVTLLYRFSKEDNSGLEYHFINSFYEEVSEWARESVSWAIKNKILIGFEDGNVYPNNEVTRGETAVILERFLKHYNTN